MQFIPQANLLPLMDVTPGLMASFQRVEPGLDLKQNAYWSLFPLNIKIFVVEYRHAKQIGECNCGYYCEDYQEEGK